MNEPRKDEPRDDSALRESEARLQGVVEAFDGLIYVCSRDHRLEFMNQRLVERIGRNGVGELCYKVLREADDVCPWCAGGRVFEGETVRQALQSHRDGHWFYAVYTPIRRADGSVSMQGLLIDITDLKQVEADLRAAKEYAERLIHTANAMVVGLDAKGAVTVFNEAAERITGYTKDELAGRNWFEVLVPKDRYPEVWEVFSRMVSQEDPVKHFENPILTKFGEERYVIWQNSQIIEGGVVVGTISFGIDVTDKRRAEEELRRSRDKLAESKRLSDIGTLAASVAHELRNPLNAMGLALQNIRRKSKDPAIAKHLTSIEKKVGESAQIINNLLRYARIKGPERQPAPIQEVIEETVSLARSRHPGRKVTVKKDLASLKGVSLKIDVVQIKEVLENVLNNSFEALADTGGWISVAGAARKGGVEITIADNGPGISPADLARVFEPFFSTKVRGTGLGLTICREIVQLHGGDLAIDSRPGEGTTVRIVLPRDGERK
ncbi:MAG: ATP-binding protein [bacterium]